MKPISSAAVREYIARKIACPQPIQPIQPTQQPSHPAEQVAEDLEQNLLPAIEEYLAGLGSSTWGRNFSIDSQDGRQRASAYILNVMRGVSKALSGMTP